MGASPPANRRKSLAAYRRARSFFSAKLLAQEKAMLRLVIALTLVLVGIQPTMAKIHTVYVGTYTGKTSKGIYAVSFNDKTGEIKKLGLAAETTNPSFVAIHENGKYVYAVNETGEGTISAFKFKKGSYELELLNEKPSGGAAPCHLVIDGTGKNLLVANYSGGSVSVTRINEKDGKLGEQTAFIQHEGSSVDDRQKAPHGHSINISANNKFAIAADLGTDELITYAFDTKAGSLKRSSAEKMKPGSGPRHFVFNPKSDHAYAINELTSTITVLKYDKKNGELSAIQDIPTLPRDFTEKSSTAEVRVSPDGKFVYGSNRGHESIAVLRVGDDHKLTLIQIESINGKTPRNFNLDPSGKFLLAAGQGTDRIRVFKIDAKTGRLEKTNHSVKIPSPVCIRFAK